MEGSPASDWTPEETKLLALAVDSCQGHDWESIAELLPNRTAWSCLRHYQTRVNSMLLRPSWSVEDEAILCSILTKPRQTRRAAENSTASAKKVQDYFYRHVASQIPGRTAMQCRERWLKSSSRSEPHHSKGRWTRVESVRLVLATRAYSAYWWRIRTHIPTRTDAQCRERGTNVPCPLGTTNDE